MSIWFNKIPNVSHSLFSLPTFIKHLATSKPTIFLPRWSLKKTFTTCRNVNLPQLETLNPRQKEQISLYVDALLDWNQRMNLTAVKETSEVMTRHVEDSLAIIPPIQSLYRSHCNSNCDNIKLVDVGSGPGLPGLIVAIACPSWKVTLLESMNKRCLFLEHAIIVTELSNVEVLRARAEKLQVTTVRLRVMEVSVGEGVTSIKEEDIPFTQGNVVWILDSLGLLAKWLWKFTGRRWMSCESEV
ncbi:hypothetical protein GIB67_039051 [Kingdonia uniflora]|uniref:Ribosomal RNA small subunit methyltransferase G n=1 Tax=Kingdonia uniflora TaxID=39325 RepID=A0A7J7LL57_9MAGN|nr:hypothetical protein GIB67_039051 [Kingdonia uniflora]